MTSPASTTLLAAVDGIDPAVLEVHGWEWTPAGLALRGRLARPPAVVRSHVAEVAERALARRPEVLVQEDSTGPVVLLLDEEAERGLTASTPRRRPALNLALFAATLVTTTLMGAAHRGFGLADGLGAVWAGLPYGLGVMAILGFHEMGHYLVARRHGVAVSLPYFVPVPFGLGTFGAFISMPALLRDRRQLFDIGVAGPLAGLAVALPALWLGLQWSQVLPTVPEAAGHAQQGVGADASVLLALVSKLAVGDRLVEGHYLVLHPLAFAGWLGLMLTALNLLPVGQLDGGHVAQALFGRVRAGWIGRATLVAMVALGVWVWPGLLFWALVVYLIAGRSGLPPADALTPLGGGRRLLGWGAFALLVVILLPVPHAAWPALGLHCPYV